MHSTEKQILSVIGLTKVHRPFYYCLDVKNNKVKYLLSPKNGAQIIAHFFYKKQKEALKKIKYANISKAVQETLFYPKQFLNQNNQVMNIFLKQLKNSKFDSYISLNLKRIKKNQQNKQNLKEYSDTCKIDNSFKIKKKINENQTQENQNKYHYRTDLKEEQFKFDTAKNQSFSTQYKQNSIKYLQYNKQIKQTTFASTQRFFADRYVQKIDKKKTGNKKNNQLENQTPIKITYTCIQKNSSNKNTYDQEENSNKNLNYSRVSQTFSSKSIKKEKKQLIDQVVTISDYLEPSHKVNYLTPKIKRSRQED